MRSIAQTLGRMFIVALAFGLAVAVTGFVFFTLGLEKVTHAMSGRSDSGLDVVYEISRRAWSLHSGVSIVPALALIIVGEVARIRSSIYYIVGAALVMAIIPLLAAGGGGVVGSYRPPADVMGVFATAGFCGGFVYWLLAGRNA